MAFWGQTQSDVFAAEGTLWGHAVGEACEGMRAVPQLLSYFLAFALQLRKNHGKTSVRVKEKCQLGTILLPAS
jgi:pyruvate/2-oxoglutarate/acetoin dehydrogenase E1 component